MRKRIDEIVYLRAFAILAVIMIHVPQSTNFEGTLKIWSHYAVPLFVFISGFVLMLGYGSQINFRHYSYRRFISIIPQYVIFSGLYILYSYRHELSTLTLRHAVKLTLIGEAYFHLWYFLLIIQFYILFPFLNKLYKAISNKMILLGGSLLLLMVWDIIYNLNYNFFRNDIPFTAYAIIYKLFMSTLFYFILGMYVQDNWEILKEKATTWRSYRLMLVVGVIAYIDLYLRQANIKLIATVWEAVAFPFLDVACFILLYKMASHCIRHKDDWMYRFLNRVGHHSFGLYMVHVFFLGELENHLPKLMSGTAGFFYPVVLYVLTLVLSLIFAAAISYVPFGQYIIGTRSKMNLGRIRHILGRGVAS